MTTPQLATALDLSLLAETVRVRNRSIDRFAMAHDASHYLMVPDIVLAPESANDVASIFRAAEQSGCAVTFRSGGTSLSGQAVSGSVLVDTRAAFQRIELLDAGARVRVQPGATVRQTNARLLRRGRKLGPDPASEVACTIGGVIANNSSGMSCGIDHNSYRTVESMVFVLSSGTTIDTASPDADALLRQLEPQLHQGLSDLRARIHDRPDLIDELRRQYSMKNTMGYGLNSFLDFESPVDVLAHLIIGSEGTLAFVAEVIFRTIEIEPFAATGLLVFPTLGSAAAALPDLVSTGPATIELMDARSLAVAQSVADCPAEVAAIQIDGHAALLVEFQASTPDQLDELRSRAERVIELLPITNRAAITTDVAIRASLWHLRKGLYTTVAGARPPGTTALLEDIAVPVSQLHSTCDALSALFDLHGYENSVIFGHAKDGNLHFMLNETFDDPECLLRYQEFTKDLVDLVLGCGGSLKAEHGTGRIMAPFVRRQFGDDLYEIMQQVKSLCDPHGILNPGVLLSDEPTSYLDNLKVAPVVESEVDRCVECGYCEPACPSKDLTLTPRQRIVLRREIRAAELDNNDVLLRQLLDDYEYDGVQTCAVDGMCQTACPVDINTGDLVRRLRQESRSAFEQSAWSGVAKAWGPISSLGGIAMGVAHALPTVLPQVATRLGRGVIGADVIPLYQKGLPGKGAARPRAKRTAADTDVVYFAACISVMFGPESESIGVAAAFQTLCDRAGINVAVPDGLAGMCCGTPWKSKGYTDGYDHMTLVVLPALLEASRGGELPIVCDAASCTEGLETMRAAALRAGRGFAKLQFVDSLEFAQTTLLPRLTVSNPVDSVAIHHTCSTAQLGVDDALTSLAGAMSAEVFVPPDWGCCAFAGDRGLLHPELTASATRREAANLEDRQFDRYISANRTCEIGMSRATGQVYVHALELLEEVTRPWVGSRPPGAS